MLYRNNDLNGYNQKNNNSYYYIFNVFKEQHIGKSRRGVQLESSKKFDYLYQKCNQLFLSFLQAKLVDLSKAHPIFYWRRINIFLGKNLIFYISNFNLFVHFVFSPEFFDRFQPEVKV